MTKTKTMILGTIASAITILGMTACGSTMSFFQSVESGMSITNYNFDGTAKIGINGDAMDIYYNGTSLENGNMILSCDFSYTAVEMPEGTEDIGTISSISIPSTNGKVHILDMRVVDNIIYLNLQSIASAIKSFDTEDTIELPSDLPEWMSISSESISKINSDETIDAIIAENNISDISDTAKNLTTKIITSLQPRLEAIKPSILTSKGTECKMTINKENLPDIIDTMEDFITNDLTQILDAYAESIKTSEPETYKNVTDMITNLNDETKQTAVENLEKVKTDIDELKNLDLTVTSDLSGKTGSRVWKYNIDFLSEVEAGSTDNAKVSLVTSNTITEIDPISVSIAAPSGTIIGIEDITNSLTPALPSLDEIDENISATYPDELNDNILNEYDDHILAEIYDGNDPIVNIE